MSTEAEQLYARWLADPRPSMSITDLIDWVLAEARHHEANGHRQTLITDESYLIKLGYTHERDGSWHLPSSGAGSGGHPAR